MISDDDEAAAVSHWEVRTEENSKTCKTATFM